ncbi:virulence protein RhuM/Fic/DOC family protein [Sulfurimonas sp. SAG-AH-194-C21]|nr:virulence protein RhuM/Fic/DOC family protein [Sulfurimonas sp. SAG-AH-194-C21]MDF1883685.1 virulence protein RhuM/Fic/DOC family protein [Sulfurimonas sp. SAG-AH-194-C21]
MQNTIEIYSDENGNSQLEVNLEGDSVWLSQKQITQIFDKDRTVITKHINNILKDNEVDEKSNVQKMHIANSDKLVKFYSLDIILAVGYRTNSKKAIEFRKWATSVLNKYLLNGYAINEKKITQTKDILNNLKQTIDLLTTQSIGDEKEILNLLNSYTKTLSLLESYDKSNINDFDGKSSAYHLTYEEVTDVLDKVKFELIKKGEATKLFANEKAKELSGIIGNLYQTFSGVELYPSIEDKAAHLLYFVIKDHPFNDGNKRSAAFLFIYFLDKCEYLYKENGEKKINENALVTLTLLVASSDPKEKDILIKLIKHLIFESEI